MEEWTMEIRPPTNHHHTHMRLTITTTKIIGDARRYLLSPGQPQGPPVRGRAADAVQFLRGPWRAAPAVGVLVMDGGMSMHDDVFFCFFLFFESNNFYTNSYTQVWEDDRGDGGGRWGRRGVAAAGGELVGSYI